MYISELLCCQGTYIYLFILFYYYHGPHPSGSCALTLINWLLDSVIAKDVPFPGAFTGRLFRFSYSQTSVFFSIDKPHACQHMLTILDVSWLYRQYFVRLKNDLYNTPADFHSSISEVKSL